MYIASFVMEYFLYRLLLFFCILKVWLKEALISDVIQIGSINSLSLMANNHFLLSAYAEECHDTWYFYKARM